MQNAALEDGDKTEASALYLSLLLYAFDIYTQRYIDNYIYNNIDGDDDDNNDEDDDDDDDGVGGCGDNDDDDDDDDDNDSNDDDDADANDSNDDNANANCSSGCCGSANDDDDNDDDDVKTFGQERKYKLYLQISVKLEIFIQLYFELSQ